MGVISALKGASKVYQGTGVEVGASIGAGVTDGGIVFRAWVSVNPGWEVGERAPYLAITNINIPIKKTIKNIGTLNRLNSVFNVPGVFLMFCQYKIAVATYSPLWSKL